MIYADGEKYVGEWQNDKKNGKGVLFTTNEARKYIGQFKDDKPHGHGM